MLDAGEVIVPGFREARAMHVWTGARPLFHDERASEDEADTRHMSRGLAVVDHAKRDGVTGFLTITGGKLTTYRLMARDRGRHDVRPARRGARLPHRGRGAARLRERRPLLAGLAPGRARGRARRRPDHLRVRADVERALVEAAARRPGMNLDDVRRMLRLGMGPCQGGFCTYRATGILHGLGDADAERAGGLLHDVPPAPLAGPRAHPLRRPDAPGVPGRLDLPGHARRGAPARDDARAPGMTRIVVVGAGLAGLVAGVRLAQGGARVTVVATGAGGLHLSPGTIDVLGYAPERVDEPAPALERLVAERPGHPYAPLAPEPLGEALSLVPRGHRGPRPRGRPRAQHAPAEAVGAARPTALAPAAVAAGRLDGRRGSWSSGSAR